MHLATGTCQESVKYFTSRILRRGSSRQCRSRNTEWVGEWVNRSTLNIISDGLSCQRALYIEKGVIWTLTIFTALLLIEHFYFYLNKLWWENMVRTGAHAVMATWSFLTKYLSVLTSPLIPLHWIKSILPCLFGGTRSVISETCLLG